MNSPSVVVVVINWNHIKHLPKCMDALQKQSYPHYRLILIDNGSTDGSPDYIKQSYPEIQTVLFSKNNGFSYALNYAINSSKDPFILSLNPDVTVADGFITNLANSITKDDRNGIATPKLLNASDPEFLDSTGLFINRKRGPFDRGQGEQDKSQYDDKVEIFGGCGGAVLYRRRMLEDIAVNDEMIDESFFAYYEDADVAWRAQLRGWNAIYVPSATAFHVRGWGDTLRKQRVKSIQGPRMALRNRYLMIVKNDSLSSFIADIPMIMFNELLRYFYIAINNPSTLLGIWDFLTLLPSTWEKRKIIQKNKVVDNNLIRKRFFYSWSQPHSIE